LSVEFIFFPGRFTDRTNKGVGLRVDYTNAMSVYVRMCTRFGHGTALFLLQMTNILAGTKIDVSCLWNIVWDTVAVSVQTLQTI